MAAKIIFLVFVATFGISSGTPIEDSLEVVPTNFPDTKFQYIGNVEGKIFVKAELPSETQYGVEWVRAVQICSEAGYRLASITSKAQDDIVEAYQSSTGPSSTNWMWIDGSNFADKNMTLWSSLHTGKPLDYTNWARGRPVSPPEPGKRNCIRRTWVVGESGWLDIECTDKYNVLCEILVA